MTKNLVIDITTNAKNFLNGFEDSIKQIEKTAKNAEFLESLHDDVEELKAGLTEIQNATEGINFESLDTKHIDQTIDRFNERLKKMREELSTLKFADNIEEQLGSFREEMGNITNDISKMKTELRDLFTVSDSTHSKVQFSPDQLQNFKKQLNELQKIKKEIEYVTTGIYDSFNADQLIEANNNLVKQFNELEKKRQELNAQYKKPDLSRPVKNEIAKQYNEVLFEMAKMVNEIQSIQEQAGKMVVRTDKTGKTSKQFIQNMLGFENDDFNAQLDSIYDKAIDRVEQKIGVLQSRLQQSVSTDATEFRVKDGKISIPLDISTTVHELSAKINSIISTVQDGITEPIAVPIQIVSSAKSNRKRELKDLSGLKYLEDNVKSIENEYDRTIAQSTLDKLKRQFQEKLNIEITTNIKEAEEDIKNAIAAIEKYIDEQNIVIQPKIELNDETKEAIKEFVSDLMKSLKDIRKRMTYLTPGFGTNEDFIGPPELSGIDGLIQKLEELRNELKLLPNIKLDLFEDTNFTKFINSFNEVSERLNQIVIALSNFTNGLVPADAQLNGFVGNLRDLTDLLNIAQKNNLYAGLKQIDSMNSASRYSRQYNGEQLRKDAKVPSDYKIEIDDRNLKRIVGQLMLESRGELETALFLNTQTGVMSPSAYFHHGWASPRGSLKNYLKESGVIQEDDDLSKLYDMTVHSHPLHKDKYEWSGYDLTWSDADFSDVLYQQYFNSPSKMGVMSNGMMRIFDWTTISKEVADKIAKRYQNEGIEEIHSHNNEYFDETRTKFDATKRSEVSWNVLSKIIQEETGLQDISHILYQGSLEELFKVDTSTLSDSNQQLLQILESITRIQQVNNTNIGENIITDNASLSVVLDALNNIKKTIEELQVSINNFNTNELTNSLNTFINTWKEFEQIYSTNDFKSIENEIESIGTEIDESVYSSLIGKKIKPGSTNKQYFEEMWKAWGDKLDFYQTSFDIPELEGDQRLTKLFSQFQKYQRMGGNKKITDFLPKTAPTDSIQKAYETFLDHDNQNYILPKLDRYKAMIQEALNSIKITLDPQIELSDDVRTKLKTIIEGLVNSLHPIFENSESIDLSSLTEKIKPLIATVETGEKPLIDFSQAIDLLQKTFNGTTISSSFNEQQLNNIITSINSITESIDHLPDALKFDTSIFDQLLNKLTEFLQLWKQVEGVFSQSEIEDQFKKVQSSISALIDDTGKIARKKGISKELKSVMEEYQKYLSMGGEKAIIDFTDQKKAQQRLKREWEKYSITPEDEEINVTTENSELDKVKNELREIIALVNEKTGAFLLEQGTVGSVVTTELADLERLRQKIEAILQTIKDLGVDFDALSKTNFSALYKNLDKILKMQETQKQKNQKKVDDGVGDDTDPYGNDAFHNTRGRKGKKGISKADRAKADREIRALAMKDILSGYVDVDNRYSAQYIKDSFENLAEYVVHTRKEEDGVIKTIQTRYQYDFDKKTAFKNQNIIEGLVGGTYDEQSAASYNKSLKLIKDRQKYLEQNLRTKDLATIELNNNEIQRLDAEIEEQAIYRKNLKLTDAAREEDLQSFIDYENERLQIIQRAQDKEKELKAQENLQKQQEKEQKEQDKKEARRLEDRRKKMIKSYEDEENLIKEREKLRRDSVSANPEQRLKNQDRIDEINRSIKGLHTQRQFHELDVDKIRAKQVKNFETEEKKRTRQYAKDYKLLQDDKEAKKQAKEKEKATEDSYDKEAKLIKEKAKLERKNITASNDQRRENEIRINEIDEEREKLQQLRKEQKIRDKEKEKGIKDLEDVQKRINTQYKKDHDIDVANTEREKKEQARIKQQEANFKKEEELIKKRGKLLRDNVSTSAEQRLKNDLEIDRIDNQLKEAKQNRGKVDPEYKKKIKAIEDEEKQATNKYTKEYWSLQKKKESEAKVSAKDKLSQKKYDEEEKLILERAKLERANYTASEITQKKNEARINQINAEITAIRKLRQEHKINYDQERKQKIDLLEKAEKKANTDYKKEVDAIQQRKQQEKEQQDELNASYQNELNILQEIDKLRKKNLKAETAAELQQNNKRIDELEAELQVERGGRSKTSKKKDKQVKTKNKKAELQYKTELSSQIGTLFADQDSFDARIVDKNLPSTTKNDFLAKLQEYKTKLIDIQNLAQNLDLTNKTDVERIETMVLEAKELSKVLSGQDFQLVDEKDIVSVENRINSLLNSDIKLSSNTTDRLREMKTLLKDIDQTTFNDLRTELLKIEGTADNLGKTFSSKLLNKFRDLGAYFLSYVSIQDFIRYAREGFEVIHQLDDALAEMAKVSDEPLSRLRDFQKESYNIADAAGTTGLVIQQSTADFMRLGQTLDQAKESAKNASTLLNVSEFESIEEATDALIAMDAAFKDVTQEEILDKLNEVGNNYSISTEGLATALQSAAGTLVTAGNSIDESIALVTAGNQVVQDPSKVGTAFRTVSLRITGTEEAKAELADLGEDVDDFVVQTSAKSQQIIKDYTAVASNGFKGVDILDENGNFRSTYEILQDIADVYQEIVKTDKQYGTNRSAALLEVLAGKNRASIVASVLQSPDVLRNAYQSSQGAYGSAEEELQKYKDSISGHIAELQNEWQQTLAGTANRDQINFFIDLGTTILDLVEKFGLLKTAALGFFGVYGTIFNAARHHETTLDYLGGFLVKNQGKDKDGKIIEGQFRDIADAMLEAKDAGEELSGVIGAGWSQLSIFGKGAIIIGGFVALLTAINHAYNNLSNSADAMISRNQALMNSYKEHYDALKAEETEQKNQADSLESMYEHYKNATLGSEEYYNIRQQIAEQFPELVSYYDSEGRAMLKGNDIIELQIQKYRDLAQAKAEATGRAAGEFIDNQIQETASSNPFWKFWYSLPFTGTAPTTQADLKTKDRNIDEELKQIQPKYEELKKAQQWLDDLNAGKRNDRAAFDSKYYQVAGRVVEFDEVEKEYNKLKEDSKTIKEQIDSNQSVMAEQYSALSLGIDYENEDLYKSVNYLSQFAAAAGNIPTETYNTWLNILKAQDFTKEGNIGKIFDQLFNPDLAEVTPEEYSANIEAYLQSIANSLQIDLTDEMKKNILNGLGITDMQNIFDQAEKDFINTVNSGEVIGKHGQRKNQYYDQILERYYGTDENGNPLTWESIYGSLSASERLSFTPEKGAMEQLKKHKKKFFDPKYFLTEEDKKAITTDYSELMKQISEMTAEELQALDWSVPEEEYSDIQRMVQSMAFMVGGTDPTMFQSSTWLQDIIALLPQFGVVAESAADQWNAFVSETQTSINTIGESSSALASAMAEQNKYGFLSQKTFESLTETYQGFADAVTFGANGMQLNAQAAQEMIDAQKKTTADKLAKQYKDLKRQFDANKKSIDDLSKGYEDLTDAQKEEKDPDLNRLSNQQRMLKTQLEAWVQLNAQIENSDSLYQKWLQSQEMGTDADMYDTIRGGWKGINEKLKNERWADPEVLSYMELFTGHNMDSNQTYNQFKNVQDFIDKYMTDNGKGVDKFLKMTQEALEYAGMDRFIGENGLEFSTGDEGMIAAAISDYMQNKLGKTGFTISEELVHSMMEAGTVYGLTGDSTGIPTSAEELTQSIEEMEDRINNGDIEPGTDLWHQYKDAIAEARQELEIMEMTSYEYKSPEELKDLVETINEGLGEGNELTYDFNFESATDAKLSLAELEREKEKLLDGNGELIDPNNEELLNSLNEAIAYTQSQLNYLTAQDYLIHVDTSEMDNSHRAFVEKVQELNEAQIELKIAEDSGDQSAIQEATKKVNSIHEEIVKMNQDADGLFAKDLEMDLSSPTTTVESFRDFFTESTEDIQDKLNSLDTSNAQQAMKDLNQILTDESNSAAMNVGTAISTINSYTIGTLGSENLLTNLQLISGTLGVINSSGALTQGGQQSTPSKKTSNQTKSTPKGPNGGGEKSGNESIEYTVSVDTSGYEQGMSTISGASDDAATHAQQINDVNFNNVSSSANELTNQVQKTGNTANNTTGSLNNINAVKINGYGILGSLINAASSAWSWVGSIKTKLDALPKEKKITITTEYKTVRKTENKATSMYSGTAQFALAKGNAFAQGTIGAKKTEPAIVGELGPELRVRGTKWDLLGENGTEFADIKKGDIIFNHEQTKSLIEHGRINSRGKAYAGGTGGIELLKSTFGNNGITINGNPIINVTKSTTGNRRTYDGKDDGGNGSGGNGGNGSGGNGDGKRSTTKKNDKTDAFDKYLDKLFDWIEIRIERVQTKIDQLSSLAEEFLDRMAYGLSEKKYKDALEKIYEQIGNEDAAYDKYYAQAEEVFKKGMNQKGIPDKTKKNQDALWDKILNGEIDINSYDEDTRKVIEGTQEWIDKAIEAKNALQELQAQAREYAKSLKEVHDAQRDAGVSLSDNFIQIAQSNFEARTDNAYQYSNGRLRYENRQRRKQIRIHRKATQENLQDFEEASKEVSIELDPLLAKEEAKLEKERVKNGTVKKSHKEYQTVLKRIKTAMDHNKPVKEKDISYIEKKNPQLAAQLVVYNQTLQNFEDAKMEEMLAVAENIQQIYQNYAQMYDNKNERLQNKINLRDKQIENKTTADGQNKLIDEQIKIAEAQKKNDRAKVEKFAKLRKENATKIKTTLKKGNATTEKYDANENKKVKSRVEKALTKVQKNIKAKVAIDGDTIGEIAELVNAGYIQASFLEACLSYNEAIEQGREAKAQAEINKETIRKENEQRRLQKMKNVQNQGEKDRYKYDRRKTKAQQRIDAAEAYGHYAQRNDYKNIIRQDVSMLAEYNAELAKQQKLLKDLTVGSDEWFEAKQIIAELEDSIEELNLDIHEQAMAMEKLNWQKFDDGIERAKRLNSEIDHYYNLISNEQFFDTDNQGNITKYGMAALDLKNTDYKANLAEAQQYLHEYNLLVKKINDPKNELDPTNQEVIDRMNELQDAYWGSMEAAEAAKQAVIDLARQGYEAQLTALNNTISKYKELKNAEKEAYDYQKQITEKANNITNLEKQLAAWQNNTSEESVSKIQKLQKDIKDARQDLRDTEYSKYLSDAQKMLDDLSANFQEWIDRYLKNRDKVLLKMQDLLADKIDALGVSSNATDTVNTLKQVDKNITDNLVGALKENGSLQNRIEAAVKSVIDDAARQPEEQAKAAFREKVSGYVGKEKDLKAKDYDAVRSIIKEYKGMSQEEKDALDDTTVTTVKNLSKKMNTIDKDSKTKQAKKTVDEAYSNFNTLNEQIAETKRNISQLNKERQEERSKFTKYKGQSRVGQLSEEALKAKQNYENKEREIQELERQLNRLEVQFANAKTRFDEAQDAYHKAKEDSDAYHTKWGYVTGIKSVPTDLNAWTQEKGLETIIRKSDGAILTPLGRGDAVFNAEMTDNLWKLAKMNIPDMFAKSFGSQPVINNTTNTTLSPNTTIQLSITLPNVKNYDEFKSALVADRNFQNAVQDMTLGAVLGKNSMSKYKYA